ncbi:hypothetical protein [Legionella erythra]|uniref:Uncharacterized protein n=1 Tax=Legionella erythra TaxID=448 RepID=A0A0W0TRA8_LEGER|nr:hypothetical protein [Legionella erythra]KTC98177.1 hypothetical protein Lery_1231 [Legionella erythra]
MPKHEGKLYPNQPELDEDAGDNSETRHEKETFDAPSKKPEWLALGRGSYNRVWRSAAPDKSGLYRVLKYPLPSKDNCINALNHNLRGVRLWNEINPSSQTGLPEAITSQSGWIAPYIANARQATDEEAANKVVAIYQATRRIVFDAATQGNVLTCVDTGEVMVVDVDLALNLRNSTASLNFAKNLHERFEQYWNDPDLKINMTTTLEITKNLLYLEEQLSSTDIDKLNHENLTLANLASLSWLRIHHKPLTYALFLDISMLRQADIEMSDTLFESLLSTREEKIEFTEQYNQNATHRFFLPKNQSAVSLKDDAIHKII